MTEPDRAMGRHFSIVAVRFTGALMILRGILALREVIGLTPAAGYVLIAVGLVEFFVVPLFLVRRWRSPKE